MDSMFTNDEEHLISKYILAISIAVLRVKPNNISVRDFALMIQKPLLTKNIQNNSQESVKPCTALLSTKTFNSQNVSVADLVSNVRSQNTNLHGHDSDSIFKLMQAIKFCRNFIESSDFRLDRSQALSQTYSDSGYTTPHEGSKFGHFSDKEFQWNELNQTGTYMLKYIMDTEITSSNRTIYSHVATTFGNLVDKLNDIEIFPQFLEDTSLYRKYLLSSLKKNTNINKPFQINADICKLQIINKSVTFLKSTISDLRDEIQSLLEVLKSKDDVETINVILEPSFNYFYMLEYFLRELKTNQREYVQNPRTSKETNETMGLRTKIMSIWKEKWNLPKADLPRVCLTQNDDQLVSKCRTTLNNVLIDFMEIHPLISYSALQCLNVLLD